MPAAPENKAINSYLFKGAVQTQKLQKNVLIRAKDHDALIRRCSLGFDVSIERNQ